VLLKDKQILVCGIANHRSIAYSVAKFCHEQGARICMTYQNERLRKGAQKLADQLGDALLLQCDVTVESEVEALFASIKEEWGHLDGMVHSIAYANQEDLQGEFADTSRDGFLLAHEISAYSLTTLSRYARPLMAEHGGSIICMTYLGGERVVQNYNVMGVAKAALDMSAKYLASNLGPQGIRVNIVSPGPIKTLAAAGVSGFKGILDQVKERTPLRRNVTQEEVARVSAFLLSDLATAVTGETIHVDAGYHILGM
jgi:enoyl-[acyl-carrier protein] reductase I